MITDCHDSASLVMQIGVPGDIFFYPTLTLMIYSYNPLYPLHMLVMGKFVALLIVFVYLSLDVSPYKNWSVICNCVLGRYIVHWGSYMRVHVLLDSLNELEKKIKCEACRAFYLFFCKEFNKFNNTGVPMLDSVYHITFNYLKVAFLACKRQNLASFTQLVVYQFY